MSMYDTAEQERQQKEVSKPFSLLCCTVLYYTVFRSLHTYSTEYETEDAVI